jgi:hypothetical protein
MLAAGLSSSMWTSLPSSARFKRGDAVHVGAMLAVLAVMVMIMVVLLAADTPAR